MPPPSSIVVGGKYGRLTVLGFVHSTSGRKEFLAQARCECGTICSIRQTNLRTGHTRSCGCLVIEYQAMPAPKFYIYKRAEELGIPVQDGAANLLVTVTNHDVVNAKKANSKHCALSRASMRIPGVAAAYFFRTTAFLEYKDRILRFKLPTSVQKEIVSFDRSQIFAPGVYQLSTSPPTSSRTVANRKERLRRRRQAAPRHPERAKRITSNDLKNAIARVAVRDPVNDTPEQRAFDARISGIVHANAKTTTEPRKHIHRTQYIRDMSEPE